MRNYIRSAFALLMCSFAFAISSEQAKTAAAGYVLGQEQVALVPYGSTPLTDETLSYWLVYFAPTTATPGEYYFSYLKQAVLADSGAMVTDEAVLSRLFKVDYYFDLENNFLKSNKLDYGNLRAGAEATKDQIATARTVTTQISSSISKRKPDSAAIDKVSDLSARLTTLGEKLEQLQLSVEQGLTNEDSFSQTGVLSSYESAVGNYNATFDALVLFVDELSAYRDALQDQDLIAGLTSEEGNALFPASNKVSEQFPWSRDSLEGPKDPLNVFNSRMSAADASVDDAVSNSLFRKASVDADSSYKAAQKAGIESLISRSKTEKTQFSVCEVSELASQIKAKWEAVKLTMENPGARLEDYEGVSSNLSEIRGLQDRLTERYNTCINGPTPTPQAPDYSGPVQVLVVALVIIVGAVLYFQQKKKQEDAEYSEE